MDPALASTAPRALLQAGPLARTVPSTASLDGWSLAATAFGSFTVIVVIGALLHALAPRYAAARIGDLQDRPVNAFGYGLLALLVVAVLTLVLLASGLGAPLAILLLVAATVAWIVG